MHFKQIEWIGISEKGKAQELIEIAVKQIEYDATKYKMFIDMLKKIAGMDQVVQSIEGKANTNYMICYYNAINLLALAKRVEAAHFPDPTSTHVSVPETTTGMTPFKYDWSNPVSLSFQLQSLWPALPLTPLVMWSSP